MSRIIAILLIGLTASPALAQRPEPPHGNGMPGKTKLFISPMGEPFRAGPSEPDPESAWFAQADRNGDGVLSADEFVADGRRFFAVLDRGHDGEIDPDDIDHYETVLAPEIRVADNMRDDGAGSGGQRGDSRHGGGRRGSGMGGDRSMTFGDGGGRRGAPERTRQGAARYALLDLPEPVTAADTDFNRGISAAEFDAAARDRFALLDKHHAGRIARRDLANVSAPIGRIAPPMRRPRRIDADRPGADDES